jgi:hypothetical protein
LFRSWRISEGTGHLSVTPELVSVLVGHGCRHSSVCSPQTPATHRLPIHLPAQPLRSYPLRLLACLLAPPTLTARLCHHATTLPTQLLACCCTCKNVPNLRLDEPIGLKLEKMLLNVCGLMGPAQAHHDITHIHHTVGVPTCSIPLSMLLPHPLIP